VFCGNILHVNVISLPEIITGPTVTPSAQKTAKKNPAPLATSEQNLDASLIADSEFDVEED
jgi:hypothetical protein